MAIVSGFGRPSKFFVDGVEVGPMQIIGVDLAKGPDKTAYIPFTPMREMTLSGRFIIGRQNGKSALFTEMLVHAHRLFVQQEERSKQIRKSSYRKTKSQRRRMR